MGWLFVVWNADSLWVGLLDKVRDRLLFRQRPLIQDTERLFLKLRISV